MLQKLREERSSGRSSGRSPGALSSRAPTNPTPGRVFHPDLAVRVIPAQPRAKQPTPGRVIPAQTHRNERCHTTADVLFSASTVVDSVPAAQTHRNERCHTTADVLFSAGTAVDSVGLGRRDTPQRALPHNRRCAFQRTRRCGLGRPRPPHTPQ